MKVYKIEKNKKSVFDRILRIESLLPKLFEKTKEAWQFKIIIYNFLYYIICFKKLSRFKKFKKFKKEENYEKIYNIFMEIYNIFVYIVYF